MVPQLDLSFIARTVDPSLPATPTQQPAFNLNQNETLQEVARIERLMLALIMPDDLACMQTLQTQIDKLRRHHGTMTIDKLRRHQN